MVPIIHTQKDLGSLAELVQRTYQQQHTPQQWQEHIAELEAFWQQIEAHVTALQVDWTSVRLYQDSLPVCGRELNIVKELVQAGNRNYTLLLTLLKRGARIEGTEDWPLLLKEQRYAQMLVQAPQGPEQAPWLEQYRQASVKLLQERDQFIANRIADTLQEGETGLLFLGLLHDVRPWLPPDMASHFLFPVRDRS